MDIALESVPDGAQHGREEASGASSFAGGCMVGAVDEERLGGYNNWRRGAAQDRTKGRSDGIEEDEGEDASLYEYENEEDGNSSLSTIALYGVVERRGFCGVVAGCG